jgi:O-antigen ligase
MNRVLNPSSTVGKVRHPNPPGRPVQKAKPAGPQGKIAPVRNPYVHLRPSVIVPKDQPTPPATALHKIGLYACCGYLFSGYGNDLSIRAFGSKAYLSWIFGALLLFCFIFCGTGLRGLKTKMGKFWVGIMVCLLFSSVFSIWRSESASLLKDYIPKTLFEFFYCSAFALTIKNCRTLFFGNVLCTSAALLSAVLFGAAGDGGRLAIPNSMFLGNPNDLALAVIGGLCFCLFMIWEQSVFARIVGSVEFLLSLYILLKTGSRGGFLALAVCLIIWMLFAHKRGRLLILAVPAVAVVILLPGAMLSRLVLIMTPDSASEVISQNGDESTQAAIGSQLERTAILEKATMIALTHPILGTGPSTFTEALWDYDVAHGSHTHAIGTHNTYAQIASECGFPVLFLYLGVIFASVGTNYRIMKRTRNVPGAESVFNMAVCLFGGIIAFAVATIFHHDAYAPMLPALSGMTAALALASRGGDPEWIQVETAAGNA